MEAPVRKEANGLGGAQPRVHVQKRGWFRRLLAFIGPAYLVSVGYMDPGNWATDIEGGARFGYMLIWVLLMSNLMAVLLQTLSARLGIVTGRDLAQGCREEYPPLVRWPLWGLAEIAIAATDLAEALGTIVGLNLLFGLPLLWGCAVTAMDTFLLLALQRFGVRKIEAFIVLLVATIGACFIIEVFLAKPDWGGIARGFVPHMNAQSLFVAIGIIGATVMPHNLYLHSSLVQSRAVADTYTGRKEACKFNFLDSVVALNGAFFVNAAILVMAAANFHARGIEVTEIQQAHSLLDQVLGESIAPLAFALALLAAGQSSTVTGTLSGQIVMEGFLNLRLRPWVRRLVTRGIALVPAVVAIAIAGDHGVYMLLIVSQVVLSLQLPFATIPLIHFTSDPKKMGPFANRVWVKALAWTVAAAIVALNVGLLWQEFGTRLAGSEPWAWFIAVPVLLGLIALLGYIAVGPFFRPGRTWSGAVTTSSPRVLDSIKPVRYRHVGVALEHTDADGEILSAALSVAAANPGSKLTLVHVVDTPGAMVLGRESSSLHGVEDERYLEELAREVERPDLAVEPHLRFGRPFEEIVKAAGETGMDFLVLGSHGHHGLGDVIYGETISKVRHAVSIPVLIVRTTLGTERARRET